MIRLAMALAVLPFALGFAADPPKHVVVYKEPGRFGGWPANNGIWVWGNEIVVGFMQGYFKNTAQGHAIDNQKPNVARFARSKDGGLTWTIEVPSFLDADGKEQEGTECPGGLDFTAPDSAVALRMVSSSRGFSRFYYSRDRAKTWQGPYRLPTYDRKGIAARTDYIVDSKYELTAFITASKENGREGRVLCIRTKDGGKTWDHVAWIGPEPQGFSIMPSSVRLTPSLLLTTIRRKEGPEHFIDAWLSEDNGKNWSFLNRPAESTGGSVGNPPSMIRLRDGRLALTYGFRSAPYGVRARLSSNQGRTWGSVITLRDDGGTWDLGYPRTVQRADGKIVTVYYFNDHKDQERYIAATIWDPK
ncbi:MAG TPA: sialidase family protein [Bryobacteraceae bacterium]|nr:sialidase family protein [Bryobacteraceae bacterium]